MNTESKELQKSLDVREIKLKKSKTPEILMKLFIRTKTPL